MMPNMQKAEKERLAKVRARMTTNDPAKAVENVDVTFGDFLTEAREEKKQRLNDKEMNRGTGAEDPKQRDAARQRAKRESEKTVGKPKWADLVLATGKTGRTKGKRVLIYKDGYNDEQFTDKKQASPAAAGAAAQEDSWYWTPAALKMMKKDDEDSSKKKKGAEDAVAKGANIKGSAAPQSPEQKKAAKAQADLAALNVKEKEIEVQGAVDQADQENQEKQQQAEFESQAFNPEARAWEQPQMVLTPRRASDFESSYEELEKFISVKGDEGKQFEYALTIASDLSRGMSIDDIVKKCDAIGGKNLSFNKEMFSMAVLTLGQLSPEDRDNLYHWDELGIVVPDGEPKTDNVILNPDGSIKHRISLKNDKSFQLSSEQGEKTAAGLRHALSSVLERDPKFNSTILEKMFDRVEKMPTKMISTSNADRVRANEKNAHFFTKSGKIKPEYDYDKHRDTEQKKLTEELTKSLKNNEDLTRAMVHEAMTGKNKFEVMGVPDAAADAILSPHAFEVISDDAFADPTIARYSEKVTIRLRGKSRKGITSIVGSTDVAQTALVSKDTKKTTTKGKSVIRDRSQMGDDYAKIAGKLLGFSEMFSFNENNNNEEELFIDTNTIKQQIKENPYEYASQILLDGNYIDVDIDNPNIEDSVKSNTVTINGKIKKIPIMQDNNHLRQIIQQHNNGELDENFRMLTEPDVLDKMVQRLIDKGMDKNKAYAIATSSLQKRGILKKGTVDEDKFFQNALPDYPIQSKLSKAPWGPGSLTKDLFDKTLNRDHGWEIGDPPKPLELHDLPSKKKKTNEEGGAGEMGTKKLLKRYINDTPYMTIDDRFTESFG